MNKKITAVLLIGIFLVATIALKITLRQEIPRRVVDNGSKIDNKLSADWMNSKNDLLTLNN